MNLYLLTQDSTTDYDTYDSIIVAARTSARAKLILPNPSLKWEEAETKPHTWPWASAPDKVEVKYIGKASPVLNAGVVLASFNAG